MESLLSASSVHNLDAFLRSLKAADGKDLQWPPVVTVIRRSSDLHINVLTAVTDS